MGIAFLKCTKGKHDVIEKLETHFGNKPPDDRWSAGISFSLHICWNLSPLCCNSLQYLSERFSTHLNKVRALGILSLNQSCLTPEIINNPCELGHKRKYIRFLSVANCIFDHKIQLMIGVSDSMENITTFWFILEKGGEITVMPTHLSSAISRRANGPELSNLAQDIKYFDERISIFSTGVCSYDQRSSQQRKLIAKFLGRFETNSWSKPNSAVKMRVVVVIELVRSDKKCPGIFHYLRQCLQPDCTGDTRKSGYLSSWGRGGPSCSLQIFAGTLDGFSYLKKAHTSGKKLANMIKLCLAVSGRHILDHFTSLVLYRSKRFLC